MKQAKSIIGTIIIAFTISLEITLLMKFVFIFLGNTQSEGFLSIIIEIADLFFQPFKNIYKVDVLKNNVIDYSVMFSMIIYFIAGINLKIFFDAILSNFDLKKLSNQLIIFLMLINALSIFLSLTKSGESVFTSLCNSISLVLSTPFAFLSSSFSQLPKIATITFLIIFLITVNLLQRKVLPLLDNYVTQKSNPPAQEVKKEEEITQVNFEKKAEKRIDLISIEKTSSSTKSPL